MEKTIFEKIIDREIPSNIIDENEYCMCIVDQFPTHKGQLLVFTKQKVDKIYELSDEHHNAIWKMTKKVSNALQKTYPDTRICTITEGFEVPQAHVKIYPVQGDNFVSLGERNEINKDDASEIKNNVLQNKQ
jgi:histidine triad (HIT) family protein